MTRSRSLVLAALVGFAAFAGCITAEDVEPEDIVDDIEIFPEAWAARALPYGGGHDHANPAHHRNLTTPNFEVVGWDPLVTDHHGRTSGYFCGGVAEDGERRLAVTHSFPTDVAFVVVDVTDPASPEKVGELVLPRVWVLDVDVTEDAQWAIVSASPRPGPTDTTPARERDAPYGDRPYYRDACTGETRPVDVADALLGPENEVPYWGGVLLVDLADPSNPVIADYEPQPVFGAHSVHVADSGGEQVVLSSVVNFAHAAAYYQFFTIQETPLGGQLLLESTFKPAPRDGGMPFIAGHLDGWIQDHPITGDRIAYLAYWEGGFVVVDLNDLKVPREIARWTDVPQGAGGTIHATYPMEELWDGRHYTLVSEEVLNRPDGAPTGLVYVMDTTDPANPEVVGSWTLPVDVEWAGTLQFSTHYHTVVDRTMFVGTMHGGMWAVDLSNVTEPRSVGVFVPSEESPEPPGDLAAFRDWSPAVHDVAALSDGSVLVWDTVSGVYVVRFDAEMPASLVDEWEMT